MAGIGFELRRLLRDESISGITRAYGYAALLSSGPWIISILSILILSSVLKPLFGDEALTLFTATITHVYAFSLIVIGPVQLILVRFAADRFSDKKTSDIFPSVLSAFVLTGGLGLIVAGVFFGMGSPQSLLYKVSSVGLMVYVCMVFVASLYLSALRNYQKIFWGFLAGYLMSCLLAYFGAHWRGVEGAIFGFAAGHALLLFFLFSALRSEQGQVVSPSWKFLTYLFRFPALVLCGFLYNLGIWIDKFLFWWISDQHIQVDGWIWAAPSYDVAIYLGLLSIVPGLAVFFLKVETEFADRFSHFFRLLENGGSLNQLILAREAIKRSLHDEFLVLFKVQVVITVLLVIFADQLVGFVQIGAVQMGIFRVTLFGAFFLVIFLSLLTILFYFDDQKGALVCTSIFVVANGLLSWLSLRAVDESWFGYGFIIAAGLGVLIAERRVRDRLDALEYHILKS